MVSSDRVEKAARAYLDALISTSVPSAIVKAILLGDSGGFTSEELREISTGRSPGVSPGISRVTRRDKIPVPKRKRKVSRYQRVFGKHLKALKRKHPRSNISVLMKKAHRLTRKELK
jgi:hypothetical protein